ncbi:MAG TPA: glycosyl transferase family 4 [Rhodanobacteraceae bacterium]|nr:glycosyl transferase family 4 [Rhodanobacteraceae bacterium]
MAAAMDWRVGVACLVSFLLAGLLIRGTLAYAQCRGLLDHPGRRRSHSVATPRGAGAGLVVGAVPGVAWALGGGLGGGLAPATGVALAIATATVLIAGWLDDHASLPIRPRLLAHLVAAGLLAWAVFHGAPWNAGRVALALALVVATAWSINLHNFMDGIDALLGLQALFVFAALAALAWALGQVPLAAALFCLAAACLAFLRFNWPPARIFMGDVGSGTLGLLIALFAALLWRREPQALCAILILCSAFVVDATLTLVSRMLRGRRWYTAHREHLYQWLVRCGFTHARTGCLYMLWNLLLAAPCACAAVAWPRAALPLCAALYAAGAALWLAGKRGCLARIAGASAHAA